MTETDFDVQAAEQEVAEDELDDLWEVYSTSDGEIVVKGLDEETAKSEAARMQDERDRGVDGNDDPQAHGTEALSASYGTPAGLDADGTMQYTEVQHEPALTKPEPRSYDIRPCREPEEPPFSQWPDAEDDGSV